MLTNLLVLAHVLGAAVWIGGHAVLLTVVLPAARRSGVVAGVIEFERSFGRLGRAALGVQVLTGVVLAGRWIGGWEGWVHLFSETSPAAHIVMIKLALLAATAGLGAITARRLVPGLTLESLGRFARNAWIVTLLSVALAASGVAIRSGGFL